MGIGYGTFNCSELLASVSLDPRNRLQQGPSVWVLRSEKISVTEPLSMTCPKYITTMSSPFPITPRSWVIIITDMANCAAVI